MENEKYIPKESKNIIRPRIKIKMNKLKEHNSKNSISKSNTNYKTNIGIQSENNQNVRVTDKLLDTNTTNEDKDLESLISDLKTTLLAKSRLNNKENADLEDLNNFENNNNNFYLLYKKGNYIFPQKKNDNEKDINGLDLSLEEQTTGNEISQRVHTKKAKNHFEKKTKKNNRNNTNINSYRKLPPVNTSELIKNIKNNIKKGANLKINTRKNVTNCKNKKPTNMLKYKTAINSIPILDKCILISKNIKKKIVEKQFKPIKLNKNLNEYKYNQRKTHKDLLCNNTKIPKKNTMNVATKLNKTTNIENSKANNNKINKILVNHNSSSISKKNSNHNSKTKIKSLNYNNSYNRIGDLYINKRFKKIDKNKNKIRLFHFKKNNSNPFEDFESMLSKSPSLKINNTYGEMKKSLDNHFLNKKPKCIYQINLKYKKILHMPEKNNSPHKKNGECNYNHLKEYYSNIHNKRGKYQINKNNTKYIFEKSNKKENRFKNIFSINNKSQFRNYNSVKNIEISI